jgi:hypothetical protein
MTTSYIPMFNFSGYSELPSNAPKLGLVSGLLLLDSGEAENTFVFRCQDRYLMYNSLNAIRSVLLVQDEHHLQHYQELLHCHTDRLRVIGQMTGIALPPALTPLAFPLDLDTLEIVDRPFFRQQLRDPGIQSSLRRRSLVLNQVSPTCSRLVGQMELLLSRYGYGLGIDLTELAKIGDAALRWHNKAHYFHRTRHLNGQIPAHARTVVLTPREFLKIESWELLLSRLVGNETANGKRRREQRPVYVKSSLDSGGNVAARLCASNFADETRRLRNEVTQRVLCENIDEYADIQSLRGEIALAPSLQGMRLTDEQLGGFLRSQRARRNNISILVQEAIERPKPEDQAFESIGITCDVSPSGVDLLPAGQLYRDPERRRYLGSYLGPDLSSATIPERLRDQILHLCGLAAEEGYRGPLNFDARLDSDGRWIFVYDCNPRLSAVYPPLATQLWLLRQGLPASTIVNLGYRGEYARDFALKETLRELDDLGWLYTREHPRGALPLPNLARAHGLDFVLVNLRRQEVEEFVHLTGGRLLEGSANTWASAVY